MDYLIGLDIGTTGVKALLIDESGKIAAEASAEYPLYTPQPLWSEQKPGDWWSAAARCLRDLLGKSGAAAKQVAGIGLSGQMHGLVLLDATGVVLRPAILWNDQRTGPQCQSITNQIGFSKLLELTGNPMLPGFTAPKIIWVRDNEPDVYHRIAHFLLPKDYVRYRITGRLASDVSDASGTSLFDVRARRWSTAMFEALGIPIQWAPDCFESTDITGRVTAEAAAVTGLPEGTPVVGGGGDQAAQAIGTGLVHEGQISVTLGTSGTVFAPTHQPAVDLQGRLHTFCHAVPGMWHVMGVMLSAGGSLRWFRDTLGQLEIEEAHRTGQDPYEILMAEAARAAAGCEGLLFLPYLSGERTPHPDPNARGVFLGLTLRHQKSHLIRAVLEGVGYGLRDSLELIQALGIQSSQVRASGGGARSELWRQILADIFGLEVAVMNVTEGAAFGAALLAGVGAGVYQNAAEAGDKTTRIVADTQPDLHQIFLYNKHYSVFREMYPLLKATFQKLTTIST